MRFQPISLILSSLLLACSLVSAGAVDFNRDVRPILSDKCFACHGPDKKERKADLRLDTREGAFADLGGYAAIVAGKPEQSEAYHRLVTDDKDELMPPPKAHKPLSEKEIHTLRQWIAEGAEWEIHWSFQSLERPPAPAHEDAGFVRNAIDRFVGEARQAHGLQHASEADPITLARRLYLDLTGLAPTPEEVRRFVADPSPQACDQLVETLLASEHFGERMAIYWLDLVRYADTIGYHSDNFMEVSAYRDYVIDAFNRNLPYDQFTIEQLAGDLLPEPTLAQRVASGYNRLLQTTEEGGAQPGEYLAIYAADRVRNVSEVWLGATMGCCQCHDHKYDPLTIRDFYSMEAFFADLKEKPTGRREPNMRMATPAQEAEIAALRIQLAENSLENVLARDKSLTAKVEAGRAAWEKAPRKAPDSEKSLPPEIGKILKKEPGSLAEEERQKLAAHYLSIAPELAEHRKKLEGLKKRFEQAEAGVKTMLVSEAIETPRAIRILPRGNWLDESGEIVEPAVPAFFPSKPVAGRRATRFDLAEWIVSDTNPLTARAFANRLWALFFGEGISRNLADLGGQGVPPSHPELLDWLAAEFRDSGWDIKHMIRLMVTSGTYRQNSTGSLESRQSDPGNIWLARQGRWRLDAELVRDAALRISGLLAEEQGGKSVKPYQPVGYWQHLNFPQREWQPDKGANLYRRGLYTFWCRTFLHPAMLAFDAPSREECTAQRARSNTPQQGLVLLNDPVYVEASRVFGQNISAQGRTVEEKIAAAWTRATSRPPTAEETGILKALFEKQHDRYASDAESAKQLLSIGESPPPEDENAAELAAWTQVARAILNAYETTSRF